MHDDLSIKRLLERLETLEAEVAALRRENQQLRQENQQLRDEIARLKKNSSNSSKPPSSDIVAPPKDLPRRGKKNKIGGQPGHPRHQRPPFDAKQIDRICLHELSPEEVRRRKLRPLDSWHVLQQVELVDKPYVVTEHRARRYVTPAGRIVLAPLAPEIRGAGLLGPNLTALDALTVKGTVIGTGTVGAATMVVGEDGVVAGSLTATGLTGTDLAVYGTAGFGTGAAGMGGQVPQQLHLPLREFLARAVVPPHFAPGQVRQATGHIDLRDLVGPLGRAAQHGLDAGQQFLDAERLDDVIVGPQAQAAHAVGLLAAGRQDDDWPRRPLGPDGLQDGQAVGARQHQVQQHEVALGRGGQVEALVAVGGLEDREPGVGQGVDYAFADGRVVFDDENRASLHTVALVCLAVVQMPRFGCRGGSGCPAAPAPGSIRRARYAGLEDAAPTVARLAHLIPISNATYTPGQ
jgi:hypothetical protein